MAPCPVFTRSPASEGETEAAPMSPPTGIDGLNPRLPWLFAPDGGTSPRLSRDRRSPGSPRHLHGAPPFAGPHRKEARSASPVGFRSQLGLAEQPAVVSLHSLGFEGGSERRAGGVSPLSDRPDWGLTPPLARDPVLDNPGQVLRSRQNHQTEVSGSSRDSATFDVTVDWINGCETVPAALRKKLDMRQFLCN